MRGAWIEMSTLGEDRKKLMSLPVRGAWIEITARDANLSCVLASLPVRGAWIEIRK